MPAYGCSNPYPRRYGGGVNATKTSMLELVYRAGARARGSSYDQAWPPATAVAIENFAFARALVYDGYGANTRLANQFIPSKMSSSTGMLQRWEKIFSVPPNPGDPDAVRRARVGAAWARFGVNNTLQPMTDALRTALGPLFVQVIHQTPTNALSYAPWATPYPGEPGVFYSTIAHVNVQVTQLVAGYFNNDAFSSPNAAFYAAVAKVGPILDPLLPAWATWDWFILATGGRIGFYLDEPDLDLEEFDV